MGVSGGFVTGEGDRVCSIEISLENPDFPQASTKWK